VSDRSTLILSLIFTLPPLFSCLNAFFIKLSLSPLYYAPITPCRAMA
jgi:hypothetical protein